jgi:hypothetical protein
MATRQQARFLDERRRAQEQQANMSSDSEDEIQQPEPEPAQQQPDHINALISALINAANAANPGRERAPARAAPFALLPGRIREGPLDYNNPTYMKLFNKAIRGIKSKFDLKEGNLSTFLVNLTEYARIFGWDGVLKVPDSSGAERNLVTSYGQLTLDDVRRMLAPTSAQIRGQRRTPSCCINSLPTLSPKRRIPAFCRTRLCTSSKICHPVPAY